MIVYLLRHGKAARKDPDKPRCLTSEGRAEVAAMARHFRKSGGTLDALWHSPKTRAAETARLFLKSLEGQPVAVEALEGLVPDGDALDAYHAIDSYRGGGLLVVTHLPLIEDLAHLFLSDSPEPRALSFPTAGMAAFERRNGTWKWLWTRDPETIG